MGKSLSLLPNGWDSGQRRRRLTSEGTEWIPEHGFYPLVSINGLLGVRGAVRDDGNFLPLGWETILEGGWTTSWPRRLRYGKETGIPHYYFPWKDLKFYIKKKKRTREHHSILFHKSRLPNQQHTYQWITESINQSIKIYVYECRLMFETVAVRILTFIKLNMNVLSFQVYSYISCILRSYSLSEKMNCCLVTMLTQAYWECGFSSSSMNIM